LHLGEGGPKVTARQDTIDSSAGKILKGVLEPFSTQGKLDMLKRAGFENMTSIMKYICFEGFIAIK
jgi:tRNA (cmo5U34)-methyltransferase